MKRSKLYLAISLALPLASQAWDNNVVSLTPAGTEQTRDENFIEFGLGQADAADYDFGKYSGLKNDNTFLIGDFNYSAGYGAGGNYAKAEGRNLGLDSRSLFGEYGKQGRFSVYLDYREIPNYKNENLRTPYRGSGTDRLTLPFGWPAATDVQGLGAVDGLLVNFDEGSKRKKLATGFSLDISQSWSVRARISREHKDGTELTSAIFGTNGGNPKGALVAQPLGQKTDDFLLAFSHQGNYGVIDFGARLSQFKNDDQALGFQSAFTGNATPAADYPFGLGQMSLNPDNQMLEGFIKGMWRPSSWVRLSYHLKLARLEQDDDFLPYTVNALVSPTAFPLPADNANARVDKRYANIGLTLKPWRAVGLKFRYIYDDRDNKTPRERYTTVKNDTANQVGLPPDPSSADIRINAPYDRNRQLLSGDLNWRINRPLKLSFGYDREWIDRNLVSVEKSTENTYRTKLSYRPIATLSGWVKLAYADRTADDYEGGTNYAETHTPQYIAGSSGFENDPMLRQFYLADRKRSSATWFNQFIPGNATSIGLKLNYYKEDYDNTDVGLTRRDGFDATLDVSYQADETVSLFGYINHGRKNSDQQAYAWSPFSTPPVPTALRNPLQNWDLQSKDTINTIGVGLNWDVMPDKLDFTVDYNWSDYLTEYQPYATNGSAAPLPDVTTRVQSLKISGNYRVNDQWTVSLLYRYEDYRADDFAYDNVNVTTDTGAILYVGEESPNYTVNLVGLSATFNF